MNAVMQDFGRATRQEDPVVHFYETFLAAYDPKMRESRGVYYTPEPVVSYIVRSVDALLRTRFGKPDGLADDKTIILDPATGTATFLHAVVQQIHATLADQGMAGIWNSYVPQKLLPRLFGFELLMAPYTVAHLKMGLLLAELGYTFGSNERLGIYLTNTLADVPTAQQPLAFAQYIAEESKAANEVKQVKPVMIVIGNPPYSGHSANKGAWIEGLLRGLLPDGSKVSSYYEVDGKPLGEQNPKYLQDDYVKFIRFGQWRVNRTGEGILALISNNGYLDNPTFRGMRQSLLRDFDTIYVLNLHGSKKKNERTPEGKPDENVFDIQQGVTISLFVKQQHGSSSPAIIYYTDLWGSRESKYSVLSELDVLTTSWLPCTPGSPWYLFVPQNADQRAEYNVGWSPAALFGLTSTGIKTHRDHFVLDTDRHSLHQRIVDFRNVTLSDDVIRNRYELSDTRDWKLSPRRKTLVADSDWEQSFAVCTYRPFDFLHLFHHSAVVELPREEVMTHMRVYPNLALGVGRQGLAVGDTWNLIIATDGLIDTNVFRRGGVQVFPLYINEWC